MSNRFLLKGLNTGVSFFILAAFFVRKRWVSINFSAVRWVAKFIVVALTVAACASTQQKPITLDPGEKTLIMKVESFKFEPNVMKAYQGNILTIKLENIAGVEHNITIRSPQGTTVASMDIPAKGTVSLRLNLAEAGVYHFYCDKPLHSTFGMKGEIEVTSP